MSPGLQSADRPQVSGSEVQAAIFKAPIGGVTPEVVSEMQTIEKARARGAKNAAVELARLKLEGKGVKKWEGSRGDKVKDIFVDKALGDRAAEMYEQANHVKRALDLLSLDPGSRDQAFQDLVGKNLIDAGGMDVNQYIEFACSAIAQTELFGICFPDVAANTSTDARMIMVKNTLAQDPFMRTSLGDLMGNVQDKILGLSAVPQTGAEGIDKKITTESGKQKAAHDNLDSIIHNTLKIKESDLKGARRLALDTALANNDAKAVIQILTEAQKFPPGELTKILEFKEKVDKLKDYRDKFATADKKKQPNLEKAIKDLEADTADANKPGRFDEYDAIVQAIDGQVFKQNMEAYEQTTKQVNELNNEKANLPANPTEKQNSAKRQTEEEAIVMELENVFDKLVLRTYDHRVDEIVADKENYSQQKIKDAEAAGRLDEAKMYTKRAKEWIEAEGNGNPERVHLDRIRRDINIIRKYGDVGIKFLAARDAGLFDKSFIYKYDVNGTSYQANGEQFIKWVYDGTMSANEAIARLDSPRIDRLNQLLTKKDADGKTIDNGVIADYRDTLVMDYMRARRYLKQGVIGRFISYGSGNKQLSIEGENGLADYFTRKSFELRNSEWEDLYRNFGEDINQAIEKDANARKFVDQLKGKGIVSEPKMKWLIYMLMMMGMLALPGLGVAGAGLGVGAEIGGVAAAIGGGAAGLKIGGATKDFIQ